MNFVALFFCFFLFFVSCSSGPKDAASGKNNQQNKKCEKIKKENGVDLYFDDVSYQCFLKNLSGDTIKIIRFSEDSLKHGVYREFYDNGTLKTKGIYARGRKLRRFKHYGRDGVIRKQVEYIILRGESKINRVLVYDSSGVLNPNESKYFKVKYDDTISKGESNRIELNFNKRFKNKFDSVEVHYGGFGDFFSVEDSSAVKIVRLPSESVEFMYNGGSELGENNLTFFFAGYNRYPDGSLEKGEVFYISYTYYVRE